MNIKRTLAITKKTFRGIWSDKAALMLLLVTPALSIVVFAFGFGGDVSHVRVAVVNQDEGYQIPPSRVRVSISGAILANLDSEVVEVDEVATEAEGVRLVESADAYGLIIFPKDFTYNVYQKSLDPSLSLDTTDTGETGQDQRERGGCHKGGHRRCPGGCVGFDGRGRNCHPGYKRCHLRRGCHHERLLLAGHRDIHSVHRDLLDGGSSIRGSAYLGLLDETAGHASKAVRVCGGYAIAYTVLGLVQAAIMLTFSVYVFGIACEGSMLLAFLVVGLLAVMSLSLGMMLSSFARRSEQAMASLPIVALPSFLVSGIFWPVEAIPTWLRPLSWVVPNSYAINAARDVMLQGWGIGQVWLDLVALAGFTVVFLALSAVSLGRVKG